MKSLSRFINSRMYNKLLMNKQKEVFMFIAVLSILMLSMVFINAEVNSYAPVKQGQCIEVKQVCASCSYVNVTISYPNSSRAVSNAAMSFVGAGNWIYNFCDTSTIGRYDVTGEGDISGTATGFDVLYFDVTPTGQNMNPNYYYLIFIVSLGVIVLGFWIKDGWITVLGTIGLYFLGLYILLFGINGVKDGVYTWAVGIILLAIAAYISIKSAFEMIQDDGDYS